MTTESTWKSVLRLKCAEFWQLQMASSVFLSYFENVDKRKIKRGSVVLKRILLSRPDAESKVFRIRFLKKPQAKLGMHFKLIYIFQISNDNWNLVLIRI